MSGAIRSPEAARKLLRERGVSVRQWCRLHGAPYSLTHEVLRGGTPALTGRSFQIEVLLGMRAAPGMKPHYRLHANGSRELLGLKASA